MIRAIKRFFVFVLIAIVVIGAACIFVNISVVNDQKENISFKFQSHDMEMNNITIKDIGKHEAQAIIILGAGVYADGTPSPMLKDRLDAGIKLYKAGVAPKILVSGDNGQVEYNEVGCMLNYLMSRNIPQQDIFCDHAGFSTYDSMYRAEYIFKIEKAIVVTQTYHLYRALYIANSLGMDTIGVGSDQETYSGQIVREAREVLARDKDVLKCFVKAKATVGGETISINGSGIPSQ